MTETRLGEFDCKCVQDVKTLLGKDIATQGPQGTVSSVLIGDEKRFVESLKEIQLLERRVNSHSMGKFKLQSLLTLVVETTFAEMRGRDKDMSMQVAFDYRFSHALKERLK